MTVKDDMLLNMLEELVRAWRDTFTPAEVRQDLSKIRLLNQARESITEGAPSEFVRQFYREIFLRDLWSGNGA